tara:strand:+ start:2809 stop:3147 length:339 start_codon:yes stop_codon:yes gene_type:complete
MNSEVKIPETCVLKFEAKWCGPCKTIKPHIDELKEKYPNIEVICIDADENPELCAIYRISKLPTFVFKYTGRRRDVIGIDKIIINNEFENINKHMANQIKDQTQYTTKDTTT